MNMYVVSLGMYKFYIQLFEVHSRIPVKLYTYTYIKYVCVLSSAHRFKKTKLICCIQKIYTCVYNIYICIIRMCNVYTHCMLLCTVYVIMVRFPSFGKPHGSSH